MATKPSKVYMISNIHFNMESQTSNTLHATWTDKNLGHGYVSGWSVKWEYDAGDGYYYMSSEVTENYSTSSYSIPDNANYVRITIESIPNTRSSGNNKVPYFNQSSTRNSAVFNVSTGKPLPESPVPEIGDLEGNSVVISINSGLSDLVKNGCSVEFEVVQDNNRVYDKFTKSIYFESVAFTYTLEAGHKYKFRCRAAKGNRRGNWSEYTSEKESAPISPKSITKLYVRTVSANEWYINLEWSGVSSAKSYIIDYTNDSGKFNTDEPINSNETTDTHFELSEVLELGNTYYFRVCAVNSDDKRSSWTAIKSITVGRQPSPPTIWSSVSKCEYDESNLPMLYWVHNSSDNSQLTSSKVKIITKAFISGQQPRLYTKTFTVAPQTELQNGVYVPVSIQEFDITPKWAGIKSQLGLTSTELANLDYITLSWSVSTAGIAVDTSGDLWYSDYSEVKQIEMYPVSHNYAHLQCTNASGVFKDVDTVTHYPIRLVSDIQPYSRLLGIYFQITANDTYEITDDFGMSKTVISGDVIYSENFGINDFTYDEPTSDNGHSLGALLDPGNINMLNGVGYKFTAIASFENGVQSTSVSSFTVQWSDQYDVPSPEADIVVDFDELTASIRPYCIRYDEESKVETPVDNILLSVYRKNYDGTFTSVGSGIKNLYDSYAGTVNPVFVTDPHPSLSSVVYRIVAKNTITGAISYSDINGPTLNEPSIVIQWNDEWLDFKESDDVEHPKRGSMVKLPYNIDISSNNSPDVELISYIGRSHPVSYYGTQIGETASWNTEIPKSDTETLFAIRRLQRWLGNVYVREPNGSGYWANVTVQYNINHLELTIPISLTITRVEGDI